MTVKSSNEEVTFPVLSKEAAARSKALRGAKRMAASARGGESNYDGGESDDSPM
jgi:hypothetical protein